VSVDIIPYEPKVYTDLPRLHKIVSAWEGLDRILTDIVQGFEVNPEWALEFGVSGGYSTVALANLFEFVVGVDTFTGDPFSGIVNDHFQSTSQMLSPWPNIRLSQHRYQDWILFDDEHYDLIHVDINHTYEDTFTCGRWAVDHADVVLFHDTQTFPEVKRAVYDIANEAHRSFYNYEKCHGLGILSLRERQ
jgi:hypothetical protein